MPGPNLENLIQILGSALTESGVSLVQLSAMSPVLLVFLRHAGCTFCREAIADIAAARQAIEATGAKIVLVHMGDTEAIEKLLAKHGLADVERICDGERKMYRAFGLKRGTLRQLFGPKVLWRAFPAGGLFRHGIGLPSADSSQMPGLFLIEGSRISGRFRHETAADQPDYARICAALVGARGGQ